MNTALPQLDDLMAMRNLLLRNLAGSLEVSQAALACNDAESIALGAARQAELCRQWSLLEDQLGRASDAPRPRHSTDSSPVAESEQYEEEFAALTIRIRHLTRVHSSLLRHLHRSLAIVQRVVESCQPTYSPDLTLLRVETHPQAGD